MGFGSYDESEQRDQEVTDDGEEEGIDFNENEHAGEVTFESDTSTDDLVDRLQDIKAEKADEE